MTTIEPMVVPGPPPSEGQPVPPGRRWRLWPAVLISVLLLLLLASVVPLPYYAVAPGSARQVNDLVRVPKDKAFPPRGKIYLATVALKRARTTDALVGWLDAETDVVPQAEVLGSTPPDQLRRQNRALMDDSKQTATVVALRQLGFPVAEHGTGALVVAAEEGSPADGRLAPDDVIIAIDGQPTSLASHAVTAIRARRPGDSVRLDVRARHGAARREQVTLKAHPDRQGGFLGVLLRTKDQRFDFPFEVKIESGEIGGPSAGLAYTLGILDSLTTGELTGAKKVAATGTIEIDGTVGNVGGVAQKTAAVRSAGADYFLVPADEFEEAVSHAGKELKVMKVSSITEAVTVLEGLGGDVDPRGSRRPGTRG